MVTLMAPTLTYDYVTSNSELHRQLALRAKCLEVALDTETYPKTSCLRASGLDPHTSHTRLVSICDNAKGARPLLIDLLHVTDHEAIRDYILNPERTCFLHNAVFDMKALFSILKCWPTNFRCSMVAYQTLSMATGHKVAQSRGFGLKEMVRDLFRIQMDKSEQVSDWSAPSLSLNQLSYASLDVASPPSLSFGSCIIQAYKILHNECKRIGMERGWELNQAMLPITACMEYRGYSPNQTFLKTLEKIVEEEQLAPLQLQLSELLGLPMERQLSLKGGGAKMMVRPSPESLTLLNNKKALVEVVRKVSGVNLPSLEAEVLDPYRNRPLFKKLIDYTRYTKLLGDVKKYQQTNYGSGALHSSFIIVGTATGRYACTGIAGEKLNIQQASGVNLLIKVKGDPWEFYLKDSSLLDKERYFSVKLRNCIESREGYTLVDLDYSKQELYAAAVLASLVVPGGERAMIDAFWREINKEVIVDPETKVECENPLNDIHTLTTLAFFPELKEIPLHKLGKYVKKHCPPGKAHPYRHIGKIGGLSVIYGKQASNLAADFGMSEEEGKVLLKNYSKAYPSLWRFLKEMGNQSYERRWLDIPWLGKIWVSEANAKGIQNKASIGRKGANALVQAVSAIMMKLAMHYMAMDSEIGLGRTCFPLAVIHDGFLAEVPGRTKLLGFNDVEENGLVLSYPIFEQNPDVTYFAERLKQCMLKAEEDILSEILGKRAPSKVDYVVGNLWLH